MTDSQQAAAQLREAERLEHTVLRASKWYAGYLAIFGGGALAMGLALGLFPGVRTVIWATSAWGVFVAVMAVYALRQRVQARGFALILALSFGIWGAFWGLYMVLATSVVAGESVPTLLAAVTQPLPLFVGALLIWRRR